VATAAAAHDGSEGGAETREEAPADAEATT
jgi:hypothetical protein